MNMNNICIYKYISCCIHPNNSHADIDPFRSILGTKLIHCDLSEPSNEPSSSRCRMAAAMCFTVSSA